MKRYRIPGTVTLGLLCFWHDMYGVDINISNDSGYVSTSDVNLINEIVEIGGTVA